MRRERGEALIAASIASHRGSLRRIEVK